MTAAPPHQRGRRLPAVRDRHFLSTLIKREQGRLDAATPNSARMYERAHEVLVAGVASSFQRRAPWPFYFVRGQGAHMWDVDGRWMVDFHNGFGSMVQGHANPAIAAAVQAQIAQGSHFAAPTEDAVIVAEELARRFGLPKWRYTNSGSESTMDAIRIARGFTGRDVVMKMVGSYHGHHDGVMVSTGGDRDVPDEQGNWPSVAYGAGIPAPVAELTVPVPFNDPEALERRVHDLERESRPPACLIMEPAMMLGMILPEPGYLDAVREITRRHGIVLIFDEVKTGLAVAAGGVTERYGVKPDLVTLAKALGGGLPSGAIGGSEDVMRVVEDGSVYQRRWESASTRSRPASSTRSSPPVSSARAPRCPRRSSAILPLGGSEKPRIRLGWRCFSPRPRQRGSPGSRWSSTAGCTCSAFPTTGSCSRNRWGRRTQRRRTGSGSRADWRASPDRRNPVPASSSREGRRRSRA
jgi:glutamate-1-semialdehyde 2,1-aminomutase